MSIVFRREIAKIRSFEAEQAQAHKTTIFSGVSMIDALERRSKVTNTDQKHPSYSSLAQSVERMTVNHDVAGSSPAGGAIIGGQFDNSSRKSLIFKDFFGF